MDPKEQQNIIQIFLRAIKDDEKNENKETFKSDLERTLCLGNRQQYECTEDFDLVSPIEHFLRVSDTQSFKLIFNELMNQENTTTAYQNMMEILPEIVYHKPEF